MKKIFFFYTATILLLSCSNTKYPEQSDLNNHLLEYATRNFHFKSREQLNNLLKQDSVQFDDILKLQRKTVKLIDFIDEIQDDMIEVSGGYTETGLYIYPQSNDEIRGLMIDQGVATKLKSQLDSYSATLRSYGLDKSQISIEPKKNPIVKNDPNYQGYSNERLHFENANLIEAISVLHLYRTSILLNESLTINLLLLKEKLTSER